MHPLVHCKLSLGELSKWRRPRRLAVEASKRWCWSWPTDPALDASQTAENLYLPEDQRQLPALLQTMAHLRTYLDRAWAPDKLLRLGNFIWNRYRAVKTDIVVQFMKASVAVM